MKRPRSRGTILSILIVGVIIFLCAFYGWSTVNSAFQPMPGPTKTISLTVKPGENSTQIADDLQQEGIIHSALAFRVWARLKGLDTKLEAGVYQNISSKMSVSTIIDDLQNAQPDEKIIVVIEGKRLEEIADEISAANLPNFKKADFLHYTKTIANFPDTNKYPVLFKGVPAGSSMEGLLFPDTYAIPADGTARDVINTMLQEMNVKIKENNLAILAQQNQMSVYQFLTLASIVEREARGSADRSKIASVYWNRLYTTNGQNETGGGRLQADPTVQYARDTQNPPQTYWLPLNDSPANIVPNSPWNTYTKQGFPPTPICSPSLLSLKAAASPARTNYLYFFADKNGVTRFAQTQAEFQQLENQYGVSQ